MTTNNHSSLRTSRPALLLALLSALCFQPSAFSKTNAFTYQGRLLDSGTAANGSCDLQFTLFAANTGGASVSDTVTNAATLVTNGLFTVTLDFGPNAFDGTAHWLEIGVRQGANPFVTLSPRQPLTPAPEALFARHASPLRAGRNWVFPTPYLTYSSSTFAEVARFAFQGTAFGDNLRSASVLASTGNGTTSGEFRLVDVISGLVVVTGTAGPSVAGNPVSGSSTAITNLPADPTAFSLQFRRAAGTSTVTFYQFWAE
jgi:hypothetical protein